VSNGVVTGIERAFYRQRSEIFFVTRKRICDIFFSLLIVFVSGKVIADSRIDIDIFYLRGEIKVFGIASISVLKSVNFPVESVT
jgi:hypothetical protein